MEIQLKGPWAILGLVAAVLLVGIRIASFEEEDDPQLREAIRTELLSTLGGRTSQDLESIGSAEDLDPAAAQALLARADPEGIQVHSTSVSAPLLSMSSSEEVVSYYLNLF
jgi:hypothetical protein